MGGGRGIYAIKLTNIVLAINASAALFVIRRMGTRAGAKAPRAASSTYSSASVFSKKSCWAFKVSLNSSCFIFSPASNRVKASKYNGFATSNFPLTAFAGSFVDNNATRAFRYASPVGTIPSTVNDQFTAYIFPSRSRGNVDHSSVEGKGDDAAAPLKHLVAKNRDDEDDAATEEEEDRETTLGVFVERIINLPPTIMERSVVIAIVLLIGKKCVLYIILRILYKVRVGSWELGDGRVRVRFGLLVCYYFGYRFSTAEASFI